MNILSCKRNDGITMTRNKGRAGVCVDISHNSPGVALRAYTVGPPNLGVADTVPGC